MRFGWPGQGSRQKEVPHICPKCGVIKDVSYHRMLVRCHTCGEWSLNNKYIVGTENSRGASARNYFSGKRRYAIIPILAIIVIGALVFASCPNPAAVTDILVGTPTFTPTSAVTSSPVPSPTPSSDGVSSATATPATTPTPTDGDGDSSPQSPVGTPTLTPTPVITGGGGGSAPAGGGSNNGSTDCGCEPTPTPNPNATATTEPTWTDTPEPSATPTPVGGGGGGGWIPPPTDSPTPTPESSYLPQVPRIYAQTLKALVDGGANIAIIDSRSTGSCEQEKIAGAICLPYGDMAEPYTAFEGYDQIVTYCT